jgi:peptidoglycan/xylan/chitin deacetylase (PgdA/CDA1 family)
MNILKGSEQLSSRIYLGLKPEKPALITFLMHSLFKNEAEIEDDLVDPLESITIEQLRFIIDYYLSHDYQFVSPPETLSSLESDKKYILLTFDDGYFNNSRAIPVLEEFQVPATFFISSGYITNNRAYWWDALYRHARSLGKSRPEIANQAMSYKHMTTSDIEHTLVGLIGSENMKPVTDVDRPFTVDELKDFARHEHVHIGNHTVEHAILTNYSEDQARYQIRQAQNDLASITGSPPIMISYPNGNYSRSVVAIADASGLELGVTTRRQKNKIPLETDPLERLQLGRFTLYGHRNLERDCELYRSDILFYDRLKRLLGQDAGYR